VDRPELRLLKQVKAVAVAGALLGALHVTPAAFGQGENWAVPPVEQLRVQYAGDPSSWPRPQLHADAVFTEFAPLPPRPTLDDAQREKVAIGQLLFDDVRLSKSKQIACVTCHSPEMGFADRLKTSFGHDRGRGTRNSQSVWTSAWMKPMFWDGRVANLDDQALLPIEHPKEMAATRSLIEGRLNKDKALRKRMTAAYGGQRITAEMVAVALADFQRSLRPRPSKWDRVFTDGIKVLNDQELRGLDLFRRKAGCAACHNGPLLTDMRFHNIGLGYYGRSLEDQGRFAITGDPKDAAAFRTPSLRGIRFTAPYFHNGVFQNLDNVVRFYTNGRVPTPKAIEGHVMPPPVTSPMVQPRGMTRDEQHDLVAFLEAL
jgi:cytochrome c peroxidase